jgi:hypothetical protein
MPLAGKGMLLTSMDVDAADEAEFNHWYDREHLEERVAISGFIEARRYVAHKANPRYLCLYSTTTFDVLDSTAYRTKLANPTGWSTKVMARFKNMIRAVARITVSRGTGRGAVLGVVRLRPSTSDADALRATLKDRLDPGDRAGLISGHLLESDATLSKPIAGNPGASDLGAGDWYALIDGTEIAAVEDAIAACTAAVKSAVVSTGVYRLMWDLAKSDISAA